MSIILKALKQHSKDQEDPQEPNKERVFTGNNGFFRPEQPFVANGDSVKRIDFFGHLIELNTKNIAIAGGAAAVFLILIVTTLVFIFSGPSAVPVPSELQQFSAKQPAAQVESEPKKVPKDVGLIVSQAYTYFGEGSYNESINLLKIAAEELPKDAAIRNSLGLAYLKKELYSSASDEFMTALELDDKCSECFNNFGYLKSILGESVEAKKYLEKATQLNSEYADPHFNLAVLYEKEGDFGHAVENYRKFIALYPEKDSEIVMNVAGRIKTLSGR